MSSGHLPIISLHRVAYSIHINVRRVRECIRSFSLTISLLNQRRYRMFISHSRGKIQLLLTREPSSLQLHRSKDTPSSIYQIATLCLHILEVDESTFCDSLMSLPVLQISNLLDTANAYS